MNDKARQNIDEAEAALVTYSDVVDELADGWMTERQAKAFVLREKAGVDRSTAAEVLETTKSQVDNLHQEGKRRRRKMWEHIAGLGNPGGRSLAECIEQSEGDRGAVLSQIQAAFSQGKAARMNFKDGRNHAVVFQAEDGSVAWGVKTESGWSSHAHESFEDCSLTVEGFVPWTEDVEIVDVEDTRLVAGGMLNIQHDHSR